MPDSFLIAELIRMQTRLLGETGIKVSRLRLGTMTFGEQATHAYVDIACKHGLNPAQMALAFVNSRPFLISNIIGAATLEQR